MKKWFEKLSEKYQLFMQERYGIDELSQFLSIVALILLLPSFIPSLRFFCIASLVLMIWSLVRSFSKNLYKRQEERNGYLKLKYQVIQKSRLLQNMWRDRKTHRYIKCPHCGGMVRIRKPDKGKTISIYCPRCNSSFEKKT